jgi:SAM-dependent methyltransferase
MNYIYNKFFYEEQQDGSLSSAQAIVPRVLELFSPKSVIDIGCGVGTWLNVFKKQGVPTVMGVDGDYVKPEMLQINKDEFASYDLQKVYQPAKKYDLAISLEVGEHLPDACSDNLVQSLINCSEIVLFSAAIPGQTGTYHINEQYTEYWSKKFHDKGYICIDCIRKKVWKNTDIHYWYKQNILLYVSPKAFEMLNSDELRRCREQTDYEFITRIHPEMLEYYFGKFNQTRTLTGFLRLHLAPVKKALGLKK